jgi:uncharacterized cupredoxin-like copper-binding protein
LRPGRRIEILRGWNGHSKEVLMLVRRRKRHAGVMVAAVLVIAALALATTGIAKGGSKLSLRASPSGALKFNKKSLTAKAGTITFVMTNPKSSGLKHGIAVQGKGVDKDGPKVGPGKVSKLTVKLKKGTYTFYCPVDGHKNMGMKGKLVVK